MWLLPRAALVRHCVIRELPQSPPPRVLEGEVSTLMMLLDVAPRPSYPGQGHPLRSCHHRHQGPRMGVAGVGVEVAVGVAVGVGVEVTA